MADRFYGISFGETRATSAAATTSKDVELVVDDAVGLRKADLLALIEDIKNQILEDKGFTSA
jgi:hypothetical protein